MKSKIEKIFEHFLYASTPFMGLILGMKVMFPTGEPLPQICFVAVISIFLGRLKYEIVELKKEIKK